MNTDDSLKRFDRIVTILIQLQSKKIVKADDLAKRFGVSHRTIYRDIRTLEAAGVPIYSEAGIGYSLMNGYRLPPVMFTKDEAGSFIAAERLMQRFSDETFKTNFQSAVYKIKAVLKSQDKDWLEALESRIKISQREQPFSNASPEVLSILFDSIAHQFQVELLYRSVESEDPTHRIVEPVAVYHEYNNWYVSAYCHLRHDYRSFRTDRILEIKRTEKPYEKSHESPDAFLKKELFCGENPQTIRIQMDKKVARFIESRRHFFGFVSERPLDNNQLELTFYCDFESNGMARWFLSFADCAKILEPQSFKDHVQDLIHDIQQNL